VQSLQRVNVRLGPGTEFGELEALAPGTGVQVIGQNAEGTWFNVRLEDGREGWIASRLMFIPSTATPFANSNQPTPDMTQLFGSQPLPTSILGGGTVTPTPPRSVTTITPAPLATTPSPFTATPTQPLVPIVSSVPNVNLSAINQTATALSSGAATSTPSRTPNANATAPRVLTVAPSNNDGTTSPLSTPVPTQQVASTSTGTPIAGQDNPSFTNVFAFCGNTAFGLPAPRDIRAGQTIEIWWGWFAREEAQVQEHVDVSNAELRVNGELINNINTYRTPIVRSSADYVTYWYIPFTPATPGTYEITYVVTWSRAITDGYEFFGPDTNMPFEQETCTFTVR
jgi:hypothetical protein